MRLNKKRLQELLPLSKERKRLLYAFQRRLGIRFNDLRLLNSAFIHGSFANEIKDIESNEKLEFLGDAVLGLAISSYLYENWPEFNEGKMTKVRSYVVSEQSLGDLARKFEIDEVILLSRGEVLSGGREKRAILADAVEAIIAAYFIDSGFHKAQQAIVRWLRPTILTVLKDKHKKDYKSLLQQQAQQILRSNPSYQLLSRHGPAHKQEFLMEVVIGGKHYGPGKGSTKKEAEQHAASLAYEALFGTP